MNFRHACGELFNELLLKMALLDLRIRQSDVVHFGRLGEGQFGVVSKVSVRGIIGETYALKRMSKRQVLEMGHGDMVSLERSILLECCHPLIVRMIATFQD